MNDSVRSRESVIEAMATAMVTVTATATVVDESVSD
jgi:hypothetical protein